MSSTKKDVEKKIKNDQNREWYRDKIMKIEKKLLD